MSAKRKSADQRDDSLPKKKRRGSTDAGSPLQKSRTLRIPRPYGGEIVLTAVAAAGVDAYLGHVRDWFEQQPQELQLFAEAAKKLERASLRASTLSRVRNGKLRRQRWRFDMSRPFQNVRSRYHHRSLVTSMRRSRESSVAAYRRLFCTPEPMRFTTPNAEWQ